MKNWSCSLISRILYLVWIVIISSYICTICTHQVFILLNEGRNSRNRVVLECSSNRAKSFGLINKVDILVGQACFRDYMITVCQDDAKNYIYIPFSSLFDLMSRKTSWVDPLASILHMECAAHIYFCIVWNRQL